MKGVLYIECVWVPWSRLRKQAQAHFSILYLIYAEKCEGDSFQFCFHSIEISK